jgi:hypothetical protein
VPTFPNIDDVRRALSMLRIIGFALLLRAEKHSDVQQLRLRTATEARDVSTSTCD